MRDLGLASETAGAAITSIDYGYTSRHTVYIKSTDHRIDHDKYGIDHGMSLVRIVKAS